MLPTTCRQDQKVKSNKKVQLEHPLGSDQAPGALRGSYGAAEPLAPAVQDSPGSLTSNLSQRVHTAPRSPHSEAAFMWKAGASQHAAKTRGCRMG